MQTKLQGIANKAKLNKKYRFRDLFRMIDEEALIGAWKLLNKQAAAGIDKVTAKKYEEKLKENIERIVKNLKKKRYRAKMVRRTYIPKGKGKMRPLGIPAIEDKLIQIVVAQILNAIYEQDFIPNSFGYRKGKNPHQAIEQISKTLIYGEYNYIVEADIKGFFDNMNHDWIIQMLEQRIDDRAFIWLIKKWLKAGIVEEDGKVLHPITGSPQGGIVSPVIANIYLHYALDLWFEKKVKPANRGEAYICRYADDFICAFRLKADADKFYGELGKRLGKFELELSKEKTNIILFSRYQIGQNGRFDFLGFEFRWALSRNKKRIIKKRTTPKKMDKSLNKFTQWCRTIRSKRKKDIFKELNTKLRGYYNYYGLIGNHESLAKFFRRSIKILFKWLKRKSHKRRLNWDKFNKWMEIYGICRPRIIYGGYQQQEFSFG